jgi:uncharacterized protein
MNPQLPTQALTWLGQVTPFQPLFGLTRPHLQTIVGPYLPSVQVPPQETCLLSLADGDTLSVHANPPAVEAIAGADDPKGPVVLVSVHGLAGCHRSPYVQRLAGWATQRGWYSYRMDLRGAGQSGLDSRYLYHAGRSDDVLSVLRFVKQRHPNGRIFLCGFSLGASITLHLLANQLRTVEAGVNLRSAEVQTSLLAAEQAPPAADLIEGAIAVCPPLDLAVSARHIQRGINRVYDRVFARALWQAVLDRPRARQQLGSQLPSRRPPTLWDFDHQVTAPLGGFPSAEFYYQRFSTREQVRHIEVPTLVIIAQDDPLIPFTTAENVVWSPSTKVVVTPRGGHLGFIGRASNFAGPKTNRWLELAIVDSIQSHLDQLPS